MPPKIRPLDGIRVIECGQLVAGPWAGTLLAYYGAEVIKVEPPSGDQVRSYRQKHKSSDSSLWWYSLGRNKKTISVDLKHRDGQTIVKDLASTADVLIENFKPGRMESWNLGPKDLPSDLIYTRISGFGQSGPKSGLPGFASVCEAMGGFRHVNGAVNGPSIRPNLSLGDTLAGLHATIGILLALLGKERKTCSGQVVDVAIYESVFNMMESTLTEFTESGTVREASGSTITGIVPSNTYPCKDGKDVVIGATTDSLFQRLMTFCGRSDLAQNPEMASNSQRVLHQKEIDAAIGIWTRNLTAQEAVDQLETAGIPVGKIYSIEDISSDAHYHHRNMFETVEMEENGKTITLPAIVPKLEQTPGYTEFPGRPIGYDTHSVLKNILGMNDEKIAELTQNGVVTSSHGNDTPVKKQ